MCVCGLAVLVTFTWVCVCVRVNFDSLDDAAEVLN